jgi:hypothetical protein
MDSVLVSNKVASKNRSKRRFVCQEWTNHSDIADIHVKRLENQTSRFNECSPLILIPTKKYSVLNLPMNCHSESCYDIEISPKYRTVGEKEETDLIQISFCTCEDKCESYM